jgi:hypothetical protein
MPMLNISLVFDLAPDGPRGDSAASDGTQQRASDAKPCRDDHSDPLVHGDHLARMFMPCASHHDLTLKAMALSA